MNADISDKMVEAQTSLAQLRELSELPQQGQNSGEIFTQSQEQIGDETEVK